MDVSWFHVSDPSLALNSKSWQKATDTPEPVLKERMEHVQLQGVCS